MLTKEQKDWLKDVLGLVTLMYHICSLDHLYQVYQQGGEELFLSQEDFEEAVRETLSQDKASPRWVMNERDVISSVVANSENQISYVRTLREWFGERNIFPYLPSKEETLYLNQHGYRLTPTTSEMHDRLMGLGLTEGAADQVIRETSVMLWSGYSLEEAARQCLALADSCLIPLHLPEEDQKALIDESAILLEEVPRVTYLGRSIAQFRELQLKDLEDFPLPLGWEKQYGKIYPNDPCPCGSGKKYKKCHGRKK